MVIDVQNGVVAKAYQRDAVIANINTLVDKAREEGVPIVWVQHSDEDMEKGSRTRRRAGRADHCDRTGWERKARAHRVP